MKKVCVINTVAWVRAPISTWVNEDIEVTLISSYPIEESLQKNIHSFIYFERYENDEELERLVIELHQQNPFDVLIALSERDILRVAKLRDLLGIQGQKYFSALLYRDKFVMKQFAKIQGLQVPEFGTFSTAKMLDQKIADIGFPVLIKPLNQSGSQGVSILDNLESYKKYIAQTNLSMGETYDVEAFILGDLYHVDGVVEKGKLNFVSVSKYWNSIGQSTTLMENNANFTKTFADFTISDTDWEFKLLNDETKKFVENSQFDNGTIHAEFIISQDQHVPYFIEIASRTGGLLITNTIEEKYGFVMNKVSFDLQVGRKTSYPLKKDTQNFGYLTIYPQNKTLLSLDTQKINADPHVIHFYENHEIGKHYQTTEYMKHIGIILFKGTDQEDMKRKVSELTQLIDSAITWQ